MRYCFQVAVVVFLAAGVSLLPAAGPALKANTVVRADPSTRKLVRKVLAPAASLKPEAIERIESRQSERIPKRPLARRPSPGDY